MSKLNIVIADSDEAYVDGLIKYLADKNSHKFQTSYFTNQNYLEAYLLKTDKLVDILLVSPELYNDSLPLQRINTVILLSTGRLNEGYEEYSVINKYQTGDKLVSNIINIFTERNPDEVHIQNYDKRTKVIGVYSTEGGSGKTTVSIGAASQCVIRGLSAFYLNLEEIQSTPMFFDCKSDQNLSHIFYYLKEKSRNLNIKIEAVRMEDRDSGIHYFAPPDSAREFEEISPEEIKLLIQQLKQMNYYDVVYIDMSSSFGEKNIAILEECDEILLLQTQQMIAKIKINSLIKELSNIKVKDDCSLADKVSIILNKYDAGKSFETENVNKEEKRAILRIPRVLSLLIYKPEKCVLNLNNNFGEALNILVNKF